MASHLSASHDAPGDDDLELTETLQQLREGYGVTASYQQLWARVASGTVPARKVGKSWRVRKSDLPAAAAAFRTAPVAA